ncbi:C40 family peptidase [Peptostreptococcus faecalis]|uniref:C40 family peptidase n=1 Tax=Peptostreptococcus faecalis TaxID=2045015 RepID=UPI001FA916AD|nr:C40 family peptidase [Peptostreptococcus faecalis]
MKKAITVLGLGAAAVAISVSNASAMEQVETTADINLREQPSATSNKVSELKTGAKITVKESHSGWTNIQTDDGQSGWVNGHYVSGNESKSQTNADSNVENNNIKSNVQENNTVTEYKAENTAQAVGIERSAEEVEDTTVDNQQETTTNVNAATTTSTSNAVEDNKVVDEASQDIVVESKLSDENAKGAETKDFSIRSNAKISSVPKLSIRKGPSTSNGVVGSIFTGEIFEVISKSSDGWYQVLLKDGTTGWASGKYIDLTTEEDKTNIIEYNENNIKTDENKNDTTENKETVNSNQGTINSSVGLNVRSGAGMNNSVIGTLAHNSIVKILGEENGWYKIELSNGQTGYVGASYVNRSTTSGSTSTDSGKTNTESNKETSNDKNNTTGTTATGNAIVDFAQTLLGTRYVWGGTTTSGFDCSGFTQYVYKNAAGVSIPRVSKAQATAGKAVSMASITAGDLLYFDTMGTGTTSHVGIYMGDGKFIHASGSAANPEYVKISSLSEKWVKCLGARRF